LEAIPASLAQITPYLGHFEAQITPYLCILSIILLPLTLLGSI